MIFDEINAILQKGEDLALAVIVSNHGSVPRGIGSMMIVRRDASIAGSVGGGAIEYHTVETAKRVIAEKKSALRDFDLAPNQAADIGMICGGGAKIAVLYIDKLPEIGAFVTVDLSRLTLNFTDSGPPRPQLNGDTYAAPVDRGDRVVIFGGGHVSKALVPLLETLDFHCTVFEDRAEFAENFADYVLGDFGDISVEIPDYVCVMTRGHLFDYAAQKYAMRHKPRYLGVIGSRAKIAAVKEKLRADGFSDAEIDACRMPIGLPIKSETPEEIAVSVAAEMILCRAEYKGRRR